MGKVIDITSRKTLGTEEQKELVATNETQEEDQQTTEEYIISFAGVKEIEVETRWSTKDLFFAQVKRNEAIRIWGSYSRSEFDRAFYIGDLAEYDSFNLSYYGQIISITEKTVSIKTDNKTKRLKLSEFIWRNHNFELAEVRRNNAETHNHI
jgi:hypothetical protein